MHHSASKWQGFMFSASDAVVFAKSVESKAQGLDAPHRMQVACDGPTLGSEVMNANMVHNAGQVGVQAVEVGDALVSQDSCGHLGFVEVVGDAIDGAGPRHCGFREAL